MGVLRGDSLDVDENVAIEVDIFVPLLDANDRLDPRPPQCYGPHSPEGVVMPCGVRKTWAGADEQQHHRGEL